jgi:hypothetical protein
MNEHPVPRNVTGFQFQLIGFMTLKQFGYLVTGALIAFVFFKAPISFFRFPIAAVFFCVGAAFAFLPVQERPLDEWIVNLIKSVYQPTQFTWEKEIHIPSLFQVKTTRAKKTRTVSPENQNDTKAKLNTYLSSIAPKEEERLDALESKTLARVSDLFGQHIPIKQVEVPKIHQAPLESLASRLFTHSVPQTVKPVRAHHTTSALPQGLITGIVKTAAGILPGLLVHIMTDKNQQARLLKTNQEGRFGISLPLEKGHYQLVVEDPNHRYSFAPISFEVGEEGLHPWLITPSGETH